MAEAELLHAIRARPDDDAPRLVYADWLLERGDPRGELIAVQCRLATLDEQDDARRELMHRERVLLDAHQREWLGDVHAFATPAFERGFVDRAMLRERYVSEYLPTLLAAAPALRHLHMQSDRGSEDPVPVPIAPVAALAALSGLTFASEEYAVAALASPVVANVEALEFFRGDITPRLVDALSSSHLPRLTRLGLGGSRMGNESLRQLAETHRLEGLHRLNVDQSRLTRTSALTAHPTAAALTSLAIGLNELGVAEARALLTSPHLAALERLFLRSTDADEALADATLPKLRVLDYAMNALTTAAGEALARSPHLGALEDLILTGDGYGESARELGAAIALVSAPQLPRLTKLFLAGNQWEAGTAQLAHAIRPGFWALDLSKCGLDLDAAAALADNPNLASVQHLAIGGNLFGSEGVARLARSPYLRPRFLSLSDTPLSVAAFSAFVTSPLMAGVRTLWIDACELDDRHFRALAASDATRHLLRLCMPRMALSEASALALAASPHLPPLVELSTWHTKLAPRSRDALTGAGHLLR